MSVVMCYIGKKGREYTMYYVIYILCYIRAFNINIEYISRELFV